MEEFHSSGEAPKNSAIAQLKRVQAALIEAPATRRMLSVLLDIYPGTMCFIIEKLKKANRCEVLKKDFCQVSNRKAEYLTCDPEQFPSRDQQKLELGE